ncbi:MAG: H+-translocating transhydrogenase subunit alpha [Frankiales bacterium]|nr:H+-translocating transhydrogenase subunit alpha [Frankiales bacterium]
MVTVAVLAETADAERRVALVPEVIGRLTAVGVDVVVQSGAGAGASASDEDYTAAGARVAPDAASTLSGADVVVKVAPPSAAEAAALPTGSAYIGFLPATAEDTLRAMADRGVTAFAMEKLPRISRAQSMDALSSQALVGGYQSVIIAARRLPRFFPMFMTAAGTIPPAKVLVLGAGVAGLQAIATARRLGAVVEAYDVRAAAAEEVRSLGATFLDLQLETQEGAGGYAKEQSEDFLNKQRELIGGRVAASDVVITTAAIPGRQAPVLVTTPMVEQMRAGSIVVDLAAESGGNVEPSRPGEDVTVGGATVIGVRNLPSSMPVHASSLYARNITNVLLLMVNDGAFAPDFTDEIVAGSCVLRDGKPFEDPASTLVIGGSQ